MTTLPGQFLTSHIEKKDLNAIRQLLHSGSINLDERDLVRYQKNGYSLVSPL